MKEITENFRKKLADLASGLNLEVSDRLESDGRLRIHFTARFPLWFQVEVDEKQDAAFLYAVARAQGINGDKSDYHDLLAGILAICLRLSNTASARTIEIEMVDILPGEIYAKRIYFEKQPPATYVTLSEPDYDLIGAILEASTLAAWTISEIWNSLGEGIQEEQYLEPEDLSWVSQVARSLRIKLDSPDVSYYARKYPTWEYFRIISSGLFALRFGTPLPDLRIPFDEVPQIIDGVTGQLLHSPSIKNYIGHKTLKLGSRILETFGQKLSDVLIVPIDSHLYLFSNRGVVGIPANCDLEAYLEERERVSERHRAESRILFSSVSFVWSSSVNDEEFENLILELLNREPGVVRARKIGRGREPDSGRDILVEWFRTPVKEEEFSSQRVVVQCKAYARPVGKSKVLDITDLLRFHNSRGYLLVALSGVTKPLIDYLERENERKEYWTDWWTRIEIEERMRANMDVVARYSAMVKVIQVAFP